MLRDFKVELSGKRYVGFDKTSYTPPDGVEFVASSLEAPLPFEDDFFDMVVLSHVLEHLSDPINVVRELVRVLKPGGLLYIECPSERSLRAGWWAPQYFNLILSFYDDPTHLGRPWSPQSLRRLALYVKCEPHVVKYDQSRLRQLLLPFDWLFGLIAAKPDHMVSCWWQATGWVAFTLIRKPSGLRGSPEFSYYSFKGLPVGPRYRP